MWKKLCNTIVLNWTWNASKFSNVLLKRYALFVYVQITQNVCSWNGLSLYLPYILAALCAYVLHLPRTRHIDPGGNLVITKMKKEKKIYYAPLFCTMICTYSIANGSSIYTYRVGFKYWPCWIHCYNPSEQRVFLSGCTSFLSFIFLIKKGYVSRLAQLLFKWKYLTV